MALIGIGGGQTGALIVGAIGAAAGLASAWLAFRNFSMKRRIENIPTSKARSIAMGLVEVKGKVVARETIASPYTGTQCVYYDYTIEERRASTGRDRKGRLKKEWTWVTVHHARDSRRFLLEDDTGKVLVDPEGAEVPDAREQAERSGTKRHIERLILPGSEVFVLATASENPETGMSESGAENIMLRKGDAEKEFLVSTRSEKTNVSRYGLLVGIFAIAAILLLFFGIYAMLFKCGAESPILSC